MNTRLTYNYALSSTLSIWRGQGEVVAWGRRRNPETWSYYGLPELAITNRGYTGHEHLDAFHLINANARLYDPVCARFLSPDNYVQSPANSTGFNRYAYCMNNPVVNVDPSGEIAWFIPVIIGAAVGFEIGGLQASGWKEARFWKWDQEEWVSAGIGFMIGAGVGLSYSWGSSALFNNISHIYTGTEGAATTIGWSMGSNAIMTSNINMLSSWAQGREAAEIGLSGGSGFVAGLIGGYVGQQFFPETFNQFSLSQLKATNYITATLNGALDRFTNSTFYNYEPARQVAFNTVLGAGEGLYSAYLGSKNPIASLKAKGIERFAGRYISNAVSQGLTSVPGLGLTIASYHSMYYCWMAMAGNGPDWLSFATAPGLMGLAPPAYAWAINKSLYTSAVINPLFWLTKNFK